jgi:hypothetical protein
MSDVERGRQLYRRRHPRPVTEPEDDQPTVSAVERGRRMYDAKRRGARFDPGSADEGTEVTFGGDAA